MPLSLAGPTTRRKAFSGRFIQTFNESVRDQELVTMVISSEEFKVFPQMVFSALLIISIGEGAAMADI